MFSITEQFSAATKSQLEAQFKFYSSLASTAVDSAEKIIALNISTTKATVEKSSSAAKKLLDVKEPRELFSLKLEPAGFDGLLAYGNQLLGIASAVQSALVEGAQASVKQAGEAAKAATAHQTTAAPAFPVDPALAEAAAPAETAAEDATAATAETAPAVIEAAPAPAELAVAPPATPVAAVAAPAEVKAEIKTEDTPPVLAAAVAAAVAAPEPLAEVVIAEQVLAKTTPTADEAVAPPANESATAKVAKVARPKPAAASVAPVSAPISVGAAVKHAYAAPVAKPLPIAAKPAKLKAVATKARPAADKQLDVLGGKGKK